jgi:hypothetical protein
MGAERNPDKAGGLSAGPTVDDATPKRVVLARETVRAGVEVFMSYDERFESAEDAVLEIFEAMVRSHLSVSATTGGDSRLRFLSFDAATPNVT